MTIKGKIRRIYKKRYPCPHDGVHKASKRGFILSTKGCYIGGKFCPHGVYSFYYRHKKYKGVKVYYSIKSRKLRSKERAVRDFRLMKKLYKRGLCPKPYKLFKINLRVRGKKMQAWAIKVRHIFYPKSEWVRFAHGKPYRFDCIDQSKYPNHTAYHAKRFMKKLSHRRHKIGDVIYCTKKKRWYLVDAAAY